MLAVGGPAHAVTGTVIHVPSDFDHSLSDTRAGGSYAVQGTGLHVVTQSNTSTDKVAEYVDTDVPLSGVGEPSLDLTTNSGTIPSGVRPKWVSTMPSGCARACAQPAA